MKEQAMNEMLAASRRLRERGYKTNEINLFLGGALYRYNIKDYEEAFNRAHYYANA